MDRKIVVAACLGVVAGVLLGVGASTVLDDDEPAQAAPREAVEPTTTTAAVGLVDPPPDHDAVVFLARHVTEGERAALEDLLASDPAVADFRYMDHEASVVEYEEIFCDNEAMLAEGRRNPNLIPTSYRIELVDPDDPDVADLLERLEDAMGVMRVTATPR